MLKSNFFRPKNFNVFYNWKAENFSGKARARTNCTEKFSARNEKFFYLKGKTTAILGQKRGESLCLRALSSSLYKDTTFFGKKQITLTFGYNSGNIKKTRSASTRVCLVLYYKAHTAGHFNGEKCTAPCFARCEYNVLYILYN